VKEEVRGPGRGRRQGLVPLLRLKKKKGGSGNGSWGMGFLYRVTFWLVRYAKASAGGKGGEFGRRKDRIIILNTKKKHDVRG